MDVNRYYVPPKPRKESVLETEKRHSAAVSRFTKPPVRLPTPQAFFQRQRQYKEADKRAMMRFAKKTTVKHNLKLRRKELKSQQRQAINELTDRIKGAASRNDEPDAKARGARLDSIKKEIQIEKKYAATNEADDEELPGEKIVHLPDLQEAVDDKDEMEINRNVLKNFFEVKAPERVNEVDQLLEANKGKEFELFDKIAKDYSVVRAVSATENNGSRNMRHNLDEARSALKRTGSMHSFRALQAAKPRSTFVEQEAVEMKEEKPRVQRLESAPRMERMGSIPKNRRTSRLPSRTRAQGSLATKSVASIFTVETENDEIVEFQKALDKEIKGKLYSGEYVTSIVERGGRWWVNREKPKVHPSQRRRNTLLDDLRNGNIPLSI